MTTICGSSKHCLQIGFPMVLYYRHIICMKYTMDICKHIYEHEINPYFFLLNKTNYFCILIKDFQIIWVYIYIHAGLPWWLSGKSSCNAGDMGLILDGRSSREGNNNQFQYSCLGNPMNRGAWQAILHRITKEVDMTWWLTMIFRLVKK